MWCCGSVHALAPRHADTARQFETSGYWFGGDEPTRRVVVDKRFAVPGFGAEVSSEGAAPARVWRALDAEGHERRAEDLEAVGTRHRAAYRFVQDHPDDLAIVVSHDGTVAFVAKRGGEVVYWEQSVGPR